jgi:hypothetical protein
MVFVAAAVVGGVMTFPLDNVIPAQAGIQRDASIASVFVRKLDPRLREGDNFPLIA